MADNSGKESEWDRFFRNVGAMQIREQDMILARFREECELCSPEEKAHVRKWAETLTSAVLPDLPGNPFGVQVTCQVQTGPDDMGEIIVSPQQLAAAIRVWDSDDALLTEDKGEQQA